MWPLQSRWPYNQDLRSLQEVAGRRHPRGSEYSGVKLLSKPSAVRCSAGYSFQPHSRPLSPHRASIWLSKSHLSASAYVDACFSWHAFFIISSSRNSLATFFQLHPRGVVFKNCSGFSGQLLQSPDVEQWRQRTLRLRKI